MNVQGSIHQPRLSQSAIPAILNTATETDAKVKNVSQSCFKNFWGCIKSVFKGIHTCFKFLFRKTGRQSESISETLSETNSSDESLPSNSLNPALLQRINRARKEPLKSTTGANPQPPGKSIPKSMAAAKIQDPVVTKKAIQTKVRDDASHFFNKCTQSLDLRSKSSKMTGLPNIGSSCYMNAANKLLQINLVNNKEFQDLISQKLIKQDAESFSEFEERVLKSWSPLIQESRESDEKYQDRILFKWSLLLVAQASAFGANSSTLRSLMTHHRNILFKLDLHKEFDASEERDQQDSAAYWDVLYTLLNYQGFQFYSKTEAAIADVIYSNDPKTSHGNSLQLRFDLDNLVIPAKEAAQNKNALSAFTRIKELEIKKLKSLEASRIKKAEVEKNEEKKQTIEKTLAALSMNIKNKEDGLQASIKQQAKLLEKRSKDKLIVDGFDLLESVFAPENVELTFETLQGPVKVTNATKETKLQEPLPDSFIVQFARFGNSLEKISNPLNMEKMMSLDLTPYVYDSKPSLNAKYKLNGFTVHNGILGGGHYFSYTKIGKQWYLFNDGNAKEVSKQSVPFQDAYLCSYIRSA